ncbi:hypothetical protein PG994_009691 [Apiospora phragmitis]|uniref:FAD/NAD(P)-binding domain-containing protein n=1 Tax=Apiospora phragmitis TaxID=2905665 RepID=A0ABR1U6W0_9PEZI
MGANAVAVIGAGVSGLTAAKRLRAEGLNVRIFERADGPGGVWLYSADATAPFASPIQRVKVEYGTEVVDLYKQTAIWPRRWKVTIKKRDSDEKIPLEFDAVVVCIGTFDKPFKPDHAGLSKWEQAYPGSVLHLKAFRDFDSYGSKVLVLTPYTPHPFLRKGIRSKAPLHGDGYHVDGLWEQMFWIDQQSLIFIGIPKDGPTFLISQAQAAFAARVLAGISSIPSRPAMKRNVADDLEKRKNAKQDQNRKDEKQDEKPDTAKIAHQMDYPWCKDYIEKLLTRCEEDAEDLGRPITPGNQPFRWTERLDWIMTNRKEFRRAYKRKACLRKKYPTPESLGFKGTCGRA